MDDHSLIQKCQSGDMEAFGQLFEVYSQKAFHTAYLIVGRKELAEEAVQETFFVCYRELPKLRHPEAFSSWFFRTLTRLCWRLSAKEKRMCFTEEIDERYESTAVSGDTPEERLEARESCRGIYRALSKLNPVLRTTVILHYFNELPLKEVARVMRCLEGTVKSRLYQARKQLQRELEPERIPEGKEYVIHAKARTI